MEIVNNYQIDRKYTVKFSRAAGVKTGDGFEVEANGDNIDIVKVDAETLYTYACNKTIPKEVITK
jgi:hypothetical protein